MSSGEQHDSTDVLSREDIESVPMARLHMRLSDEEKEALEREAERQGVRVSALVRQAIAYYVGFLEGQRQGSPKESS